MQDSLSRFDIDRPLNPPSEIYVSYPPALVELSSRFDHHCPRPSIILPFPPARHSTSTAAKHSGHGFSNLALVWRSNS